MGSQGNQQRCVHKFGRCCGPGGTELALVDVRVLDKVNSSLEVIHHHS